MIFLFILTSNLIGLLPFSFTITAHILITFYFALSINIALFILGCLKNGPRIIYLFIPKNVSLILIPLISIIELVSYLLRTFSLAIRLFANMLAGHILLFILANFLLTALQYKFNFYMRFFPALVLVYFIFAVLVLEFGIAFLQAYVFIVLISIIFKRCTSSRTLIRCTISCNLTVKVSVLIGGR